ncbi:MAG: transporter [Muribaculaceae bacterium]|nr:transporter [Muribaculaceae bacterium]
MKFSELQALLKPWMMPAAIMLGFLFHSEISVLEWIIPYLIFTMLLLTFCRIEPRHLRFDRTMWLLLCIQLGGALPVYFLLRGFNVSVAQSAMICVLCPVATAAPVVTGLLGGNIGRVAAFSVISNIGVSLAAPLIFAWVAPRGEMSFFSEFMEIASRVAPMIILPLLVAFGLRFSLPSVHRRLAAAAPVAFYLWSCSLIIVVGRSVSFIMAEPASYWPVMGAMALVAAVICVLQFVVGKYVGRRMGDSISSGQSLGQKNTILAIWMAMAYLNGVASVGPAAYVIWQNMFNSWQIYRRTRRR